MSKNPVLIPRPFAVNGSKNSIHDTRQAGQDPEDATWSDGFPNVTMQPVESGGLPPKGMDFNGIFNALSDTAVHLQKGELFYFDQGYSAAFGGYQKGAILMADDNTRLFISTIDKNTNNPNQIMIGWQILAGEGVNATTASKLLIPRKIGGVVFDGSTDIDLPGVNKLGNQNTTGNAATATRLQTARTINGVPFDGTQDINVMPAGAVQFFAISTAPTGWLKANGAEISRITYANLFAAIGTTFGAGDGKTTFNLPDLRGEFIRAYDDGRGVDSGRWNGGWQGDAIRNIYGVLSGIYKQSDSIANGPFRAGNYGPRGIMHQFNNENLGVTQQVTFSVQAAGLPTANENRPRNIALLACIKI
ncbi:phage tail protein [Snodgrassella sp.]|uniref:phage tail protein n=1 Tax=Snodgrassella sp. TaxID=2815304 RepID=UPI00258F6943|nr:phage tail protein [Snodgrassella sp.]